MEFFLQIVSSLSLFIGVIVSVFYVRLAYKREKEKDVLWDTALQIIRNNGTSLSTGQDFAKLYAYLAEFKKDPTTIPNPERTITYR